MFKTLQYKALVFDLDDTLLDTYNLLIPHAVNKAGFKFQQLTNLNSIPISEFKETWTNLHHKYSGSELFFEITCLLIKKHAPELLQSTHWIDSVAKAAYHSFLQPELPESLDLHVETRKMLVRLKPDYNLYLVTQGIPEVQSEKIQKLKIADFFKEIFILNSPIGEKKLAAFKTIHKMENCSPDRILSIGNRLSQEISMAKQLQMRTCHVAIGEHKDEKPTNEFEIADWTIFSLKELEEKCQL